MNGSWRVAQAGAFVAGRSGSRFRLVSEPADREPCGTIVFVHAFAEEMNKSRRMAARMARMLAGEGWRVAQRDLCGCGDSSGDFADASWQDWIDDVDAELSLAVENRPVWLWCLRAGALLVPPVLATRPHVNLLLWQPVLSGAQHLQQFLRLHAGARIAGSNKGGSEASPSQMLRSGSSVEVGGYQVSPALASGLEQAGFALPELFEGRVVWFEISAGDAAELSASTLRSVERLRANGHEVAPRALHGPLFWQTQEIEECEALLQQTLLELSGAAPAAASAPNSSIAPERRATPGA